MKYLHRLCRRRLMTFFTSSALFTAVLWHLLGTVFVVGETTQNVHDIYDLFTFGPPINMLPCSLRFPPELKAKNPYPSPPECTASHSYLLRDLSCIVDYNPRLVARLMDKEMSTHTIYRNMEPPFLKLASSHPIIYAPIYDSSRSRLAFGRWALPKLKRELAREDVILLMQTLNSIHDLVHDPEKGYEAIRLGLVDRLADMMLHERDFIREKICMIFFTLGGLEGGRRAIIQRYKILHNLALLVEDEVPAVKHKAQLALEMVSLSPVAATGLNCADYMLLLLRLVGGTPKTEEEEILILHLATLKMLLGTDDEVKEFAMENTAMDIFIQKLEHENEKVKCGALECIALLCQVPRGRNEAAEKDLGLILCKKLFDPSMDVKIKVAGALAFITILSETREKFCKKCTINILVEILENFHNVEGQLMSAKTLSNLAEDPKGKSFVKKEKGRIKAVYTGNNGDVERHKQLLLNLLKK